MNPMLQAALGSIVRFALAGVFGVLVSKGIWTEAEASTYLSAAVLGILTLGWSIWQKYGNRLKFMTASAAGKPVSEKEVEQMVKAGQAPPVTLPKERVPYLEGAPKVRNDGPDPHEMPRK